MIRLALMLSLLALPAMAQDSAPAANANVYNSTSHQPSAGAVTSQEKAAGVAPADPQALNNTVESLDRQVQQNAAGAGAKAAACADNPSNC